MSPRDTVGTILDIHAMITGFIIEAIEDIPDSRMTEQPSGIVNHPAWTLSHLNAYAATLLALLDDPGAPTPQSKPVEVETAEAEMARFGYGTTPISDPAAYATKDDLLDWFRDRNSRLAAAVAQKHADYFPRPAPAMFQPHAPTIGHIAITLLIAHPPHHLGQLRQWRRAAGLTQEP